MNVSDVAWSTDSTALLSASYDTTCLVWDVETGKALSTHKADGYLQCAIFSPASTDPTARVGGTNSGRSALSEWLAERPGRGREQTRSSFLRRPRERASAGLTGARAAATPWWSRTTP